MSSDQIVNSLNRIEGQVRGVKRMYEEGRDCEQIAQQIGAIQKALSRVGKTLLTDAAVRCMNSKKPEKDLEKILQQLMNIS